MTPEELDTVYAAISAGAAAAGADDTAGFLARLALLLAHDVGRADQVVRRVTEASLGKARHQP